MKLLPSVTTTSTDLHFASFYGDGPFHFDCTPLYVPTAFNGTLLYTDVHCTSLYATSKPQTTTTKNPETTQRPGNAVTSTPQPRTTRASGNIGNADKDKRSSGTTLHISITGVETSQYTESTKQRS
uniref:Uncharacterized protein n=1 Tax=Magallana gigas TaxID=29159 RepID=K1PS24_MAGGI